ncbi:MAG TPA: LON peptidase substrate-binding domain-containing protein [Nitrospiria bacterium]|jgi:Lon protease-like protein|nr:LON peptidase substrate-binding domain-containing protein [Nitrospiria bacterium]
MYIPKIIPVFPLPDLVFFPKTYLPLHIFEPRYHKMVVDAKSGDQMIGMALLKEGWEEDYNQNPAIFPVGCVGRMIKVEPLEDRRFNIVLHGLKKFTIKDEFFDRSYRQAAIELLGPRTETPVSIDTKLKDCLIQLLKEYGLLVKIEQQVDVLVKSNLDDEALVHTLSFVLNFTPLEKQFLLEAEDLDQQGHRLVDLIQFKIYEVRSGRRNPLPKKDS